MKRKYRFAASIGLSTMKNFSFSSSLFIVISGIHLLVELNMNEFFEFFQMISDCYFVNNVFFSLFFILFCVCLWAIRTYPIYLAYWLLRKIAFVPFWQEQNIAVSPSFHCCRFSSCRWHLHYNWSSYRR